MTYDRIQNRRGTASQWTSVNPTLLSGELGVETDTGKLKVGDGSTAWASRNYAGGSTNASDLVSGTLNDARLSSNVPLKNAENTFTQNQTIAGVYESTSNSWLGFSNGSHYFSNTLYLRNGTSYVVGAWIDGLTGQSLFNGAMQVNGSFSATGTLSLTKGNSECSLAPGESGNNTLSSLYLRAAGYETRLFVWHVNGDAYLDVNATLRLRTNGTQRMTIGTTQIGLELPLLVAPYTLATVPNVLTHLGATIRITDRNNRLATSDGLAWNWAGTTTAIS